MSKIDSSLSTLLTGLEPFNFIFSELILFLFDIKLDSNFVLRVSYKVKEGEVVKVKVLEIDRQGRIKLTMKGLN